MNFSGPVNMTILVVHLQPVVRMDLASAITTNVPDARVIEADNLHDAVALADKGSIVLALVEASAADLQASGLLSHLQSSAARIVLMGDDAESARDGNFPVLERPFSSEEIDAHIRTVLAG